MITPSGRGGAHDRRRTARPLVGGRYFEDGNESAVVVPPATPAVADYAIDPAAAERLWETSIEMLDNYSRAEAQS
jgi:hypothetical protein